ncbi:MAG TPA: hypothetical protein EYP14_10800, partial [Planctomycetaceae bacterium]|nr:hypothetical protein [Planctomycetaceae bacterium]
MAFDTSGRLDRIVRVFTVDDQDVIGRFRLAGPHVVTQSRHIDDRTLQRGQQIVRHGASMDFDAIRVSIRRTQIKVDGFEIGLFQIRPARQGRGIGRDRVDLIVDHDFIRAVARVDVDRLHIVQVEERLVRVVGDDHARRVFEFSGRKDAALGIR